MFVAFTQRVHESLSAAENEDRNQISVVTFYNLNTFIATDYSTKETIELKHNLQSFL